MRHALLNHCAVLALCRRSLWVGDWRDLCVTTNPEFDAERWEAEGGDAKLLAHLGPEPSGSFDYGSAKHKKFRQWWEARREAQRPYWGIAVEKQIRIPPLPFHSGAGVRRPAGCCSVCGQPIYRGGSYKPSAGPRHPHAGWHKACYAAYSAWIKPQFIAGWLAARQGGLCAYSGTVIATWVDLPPNDWRRGPNPHPDHPRWKHYRPTTREWRVLPDVEVDHFIPLWKVARMIVSWPRVLNYWGPGNLRAVTATAHKLKSRAEAGERVRLRAELASQGEWYV